MAFFSSLKNAALTQDEQKRAQDLTAFRDNINLNVSHLVGGSSAGTVFQDQALLGNAELSAKATLQAGVSCLDAAVGDAVGLLQLIDETKLEAALTAAKKYIDDAINELRGTTAEAFAALALAITHVPAGTPMTDAGLVAAVKAAKNEQETTKLTQLQGALKTAGEKLGAHLDHLKADALVWGFVEPMLGADFGQQGIVEQVARLQSLGQTVGAGAAKLPKMAAAIKTAFMAQLQGKTTKGLVEFVHTLQRAMAVIKGGQDFSIFIETQTNRDKLEKKVVEGSWVDKNGFVTSKDHQKTQEKNRGMPRWGGGYEPQDYVTVLNGWYRESSEKAKIDTFLSEATKEIVATSSDVKALIAFIDAVGTKAGLRYPSMLTLAVAKNPDIVDPAAMLEKNFGDPAAMVEKNMGKLVKTGGKFVGCASRVLGPGTAVADLVPVVAELTAEIIDLVPKLGDFANVANGDFTSVMQVANVANAALGVIDWVEKQVQRAKESQQKHDELWEKKMELLPLGNEQGGASVDYLHADCYDVDLLQPHTWGWHNKGTKMVGRTFDECWQACENDSSCFSVVYGPTIESLRGAFTDHATFGHCYLKRRGCDLRQSTSDHFGMQVRAKVGVPVERGSKEALQLSALFNLVSPVLTPKLYAKLAPHVLEPVDFKNSPRASQDSETSRFLLPGAAVPDADLLEQLFVTLPPELFNERIVGLGSIANTKEYLGLRDWTGETSFWLSRPDQLAKLVNENSVERFALIFDGHATARDWYNLLLKEAKAGGRDHVVATIETIEEVLADQKQKVRTNFRGLTPREKLRLRSSADPLLSPWKAAEEDAAGAQERLLRQARTAEKMKEILKAHNSASTSSQARGLPMLPTPHENALDEKDALALEALSQSRERGDELQERLVQLREMRQRGQREQKKQQKEVVDKLVNSYENAAEEFREAAGVYGKRLLEQQEEALDKKDALAQEALSQSRERGDELDERLVEQQRKYEALLKQQNQKAMAQAEEAEKKAEEAEQKAEEAEKRAVAFREQASQQVVKDLRDDNQRLLKVLEGFSQTTQAIFERSKLTVEQPAAATSPSTQISEEMVAAVKPSSSSASKASPVASTQISEEMVAAVKPGFQKAPPSSSTSLGGSSFLGGTSVGGWVALSALAPLLLAGFIAVSYAMCLRRKGRASAARRKTVRQTLTSRQTTTSPDDSAREGVLFSLGGNDDDEEVAIGTGTAVVLN